MADPLYPDIKVILSRLNGSESTLISTSLRAMRAAKLSRELQEEFKQEATSNNYEQVIATIEKWFTTTE